MSTAGDLISKLAWRMRNAGLPKKPFSLLPACGAAATPKKSVSKVPLTLALPRSGVLTLMPMRESRPENCMRGCSAA